ncbi:MAG: hypothetical protein RL382_741 [Actinomycetota bacterium]
MKRLLSFVLIAAFLVAPSAHAAPKKIAVKPLQFLTTVGTPEEVSGVVVSGKSIIVFGSKASKAYARAVDTTGKELWNLSLDQSAASIATSAAVDAAGDIWVAGATPLALGLIPPSPAATPINPDNAAAVPTTNVGNLQAVTLWRVTAAGVLAGTNTLPTSLVVFPTAISVDRNGASIVGIIGTEKGNAGFFVNTDKLGVFSKLLQIGSVSTTADAIVRHTDGSFTVAGSSSETLTSKRVAGITDGVLIKISKALKITNVVRSSAVKGKRIWNSASSTLLLGGQVVVGSKTETAITKFTTSFAPSWTYRFPATGPALTVGSTHALFISTGQTAQLNWNPKVATPLLLTFNSKGTVIAADNGPVGQKEVLGAVLSKELGLLVVTSSADTVSIFTLIPR